MTQEEKQLLLQDLCARTSYGLICSIYRIDDCNVGWRDEKLTGYFMIGTEYEFYFGESPISIDNIFKIKPYLRPLSSMTEEEENEWHGLNVDPLLEAVGEQQHTRIEDLMLRAKSQYNPVDWLNAHHFDYRGLIEKGSAIAVTEDNNPYKE